MSILAEAYSKETFQCDYCKQYFEASVATWVDVSRTPQVRMQLKRWEFNMSTCPHCRRQHFSDSPFFYEDFAEGLLIAIFPRIPENHESLERQIRSKYGYYPTLEFFYDMTQLLFLIYLQDHYRKKTTSHTASKIGIGDDRLQRFLQFLKKDPLMLTIREALTNSFSGERTNDDLQTLVWRALAKIEGMAHGRRITAVSSGPVAK